MRPSSDRTRGTSPLSLNLELPGTPGGEPRSPPYEKSWLPAQKMSKFLRNWPVVPPTPAQNPSFQSAPGVWVSPTGLSLQDIAFSCPILLAPFSVARGLWWWRPALDTFQGLFSHFLSRHTPLFSLSSLPLSLFPFLFLSVSPSPPNLWDLIMFPSYDKTHTLHLVFVLAVPSAWNITPSNLSGLIPTLYNFLGKNFTWNLIFSEIT